MNIFLSSKYTQKVGTDAPSVRKNTANLKPPKPLQKAPPSFPVRGGVPNEVLQQAQKADRRGRLSLLCGIPLDRKKHSNR